MTALAALSAATQPQAATNVAAKKSTVDYQAFLRLLVAQAQNQDPTNPTDSTQYLSQLASFSSVEQSIQTNQKLDELLSTSRIAQATGLVGREIASADGAVAGRVASVTLANGGVFATLADGRTLALADGVTIAGAPAA
jgi:flagellar basal-body rod modification protein FlgD